MRLYKKGIKVMQIVAMTGLSYPTVRSAIDLYEAGGWSAVRPALRGRSRGDGRVLSQAQEDVIQRMIIDKRPEQLNMYFNIEAVNEVVARMNPDIRYGGNRAFYVPGPGRDFIQVPHEGAFNSAGAGAAGFSGTLLHAIAHWSGGSTRLNRQFGVWGTDDYAREEIRAELASAMLSAELGVPTTTENHAAYIGSWVKRLKEDKFEIFRAARDAGKIADFLTGRLVLDAVAEPACKWHIDRHSKQYRCAA